jgi:hypothetical protein
MDGYAWPEWELDAGHFGIVRIFFCYSGIDAEDG